MATTKTTEPELSPEEQLSRERDRKRHEALMNAEPATADQLVKRKPNRFKVAVNLGSVDEPQYVSVTFQQLPRDRWDEMLDEYTPEATKENPHPDEDMAAMFAPLVSECSFEPKLSVDEAQAIYDSWNSAERNLLYQAAVRTNVMNRMEVLGNV